MTNHKIHWSAAELLSTRFPEPKWAVPGVVAEGVNLLAGAPKVGKSWASLNLAVAVAAGGKAFGSIDVAAGPVLYLALEDTPRRLADRLRKVLGPSAAPVGLTFVTECAAINDGGIEKISAWLTNNPTARMVIVDVFARIRGRANDNASAYDVDYAAMSVIKQLADRFHVAVLVVHHTRKASSEDFLHEVSGTNGLAGAADAVLVLKRMRGKADAELHVTGRDVDEHSYALNFDSEAGLWHMLDGPAQDYALGDTRQSILAHLREVQSATPKQVASALSLNYELAKKTCRRMADDGQLDTDGQGTYFPLSLPAGTVPGVPAVPEPSFDNGQGDYRDTGDSVLESSVWHLREEPEGPEGPMSHGLDSSDSSVDPSPPAPAMLTAGCGHPLNVVNTANGRCALCIVGSAA